MASFKDPNYLKGVKAGADLSGSLHKAVKLDSSGDIVLAGAGEGIGILMNAPALGRDAEVSVNGGGGLGSAGGTISVGDPLKSDASGNLVLAAVAGDRVIAEALEAAVTGQAFSVLLTNYKI